MTPEQDRGYQLWLEMKAWKQERRARKEERDSLTQAQLKSLLRYEPATGYFIWLVSYGKRAVGQQAGYIASNGYRYIQINGDMHLAHRLAFVYMTGEFPKKYVDHINRDRGDNRWVNLRQATTTQSVMNRVYRQRTLPRGVWRNGPHSYGAQCCGVYLGSFDSIEKAEAEYQKAAREMLDIEFLPDGVLKPRRIRRI